MELSRARSKDGKSKQTIEALSHDVERAASQSTSLVNTQLEMSDRSSVTPNEHADYLQPSAKEAQAMRDMDDSTVSNGDLLDSPADSTTEPCANVAADAMARNVSQIQDNLLECINLEVDLHHAVIKQEIKLDAQTQRVDEVSGILLHESRHLRHLAACLQVRSVKRRKVNLSCTTQCPMTPYNQQTDARGKSGGMTEFHSTLQEKHHKGLTCLQEQLDSLHRTVTVVAHIHSAALSREDTANLKDGTVSLTGTTEAEGLSGSRPDYPFLGGDDGGGVVLESWLVLCLSALYLWLAVVWLGAEALSSWEVAAFDSASAHSLIAHEPLVLFTGRILEPLLLMLPASLVARAVASSAPSAHAAVATTARGLHRLVEFSGIISVLSTLGLTARLESQV